MNLPKQLLVYVDGEGDDACLIAVSDISEIPADQHGEIVGRYTRQSTGILTVERSLA